MSEGPVESGPKQDGDVEYLQICAERIKQALPDNHGFILITFPFGVVKGGRVRYVSDARRDSALSALREFTKHAEQNWAKHEED